MFDLQLIKSRLAAATPGPWEIDERYSDCHVVQGEKALFTVEADARKNDVELVACAPQDLAALVAEVERLRKMLKDSYVVTDGISAAFETLANAVKRLPKEAHSSHSEAPNA